MPPEVHATPYSVSSPKILRSTALLRLPGQSPANSATGQVQQPAELLASQLPVLPTFRFPSRTGPIPIRDSRGPDGRPPPSYGARCDSDPPAM